MDRGPVGFGAALRAGRAGAGLTQEDLAELTGLSVRAIRNLELGRTARPHRQSVALLVDALRLAGAPHVELIGDEPRAGPRLSHRCELPPDVDGLAGRDAVLAELGRFLDGGARGPRTVAVTGPPGAGVTALVTHLAHRARDRFPDAQLYVDLGADPAGPMGPDELIARVLRSLGAVTPDSAEEATALLRATLYARRVLIVVDNVTGEAQVRPLLSASAQCAVLVAGHRRLPALDCGRTVELGPLDPDAAMRVLARPAGAQRVAAEPRGACAVAQHCGHLPLALHIAGAWLRARPHRRLAELAALLDDGRRRLDLLAVGDLAVRASLDAQFARLRPRERELLRAIGSLRLRRFGVARLADQLGTDPARCAALLEDLAAQYLVLPVPGSADRYRVPELTLLHLTDLADLAHAS